MKHISFTIITLFLFSLYSSATSESWKTYLSYFTTQLVEESSTKVYAVAEGALFSYDKEDNSIRQFDKSNYLNDVSIIAIHYNTMTKSLLIVYENANMDILSEDGVINLPYLQQSTQVRNKEIYSVFLYKEYAYIATGFGIMVVNMKKNEITETYNFSFITTSCCIYKDYIYASTETGIIYAPLDVNLLDINNWTPYEISSEDINDKEISRIFVYKDQLCYLFTGSANTEKNGIYYGPGATPVVIEPTIKSIKLANEELLAICTSKFLIFNNLTSFDTINNISIQDITTSKNMTYWLAAGVNGLRAIEKTGTNVYQVKSDSIQIDGPRMNSPYKIVCTDSKVYLIAGGKNTSGNQMKNDGIIMIYDYEKWKYIDQNTVIKAFSIHPMDYNGIAIDPANEDHFYVSAFGRGVFEFNGMEVLNAYHKDNSLLETTNNSSWMNMHYIDGACADKEGNIWFTNSLAEYGIKILRPDREWERLQVPALTRQECINDILITSSGRKWVNILMDESGIVIIDEYNTYFTDAIRTFTNQEGKVFSPTYYTSMAEDKDGYVWVGTTDGPIYFTQPDLVSEDKNNCMRVILTNEDNGELYYFLENNRINCITVDEGNRKWFGTNGNGVYVLNENNDEVIYHFNTTNSPLLSDVIYNIETNKITGEVFIGTDKGLISYQGEAIAGKDNYSDVYTYPNPVRPEYDDRVTITGLMNQTNIKITDLNGNLIYQTKSIGGQASWNCRNKSGQRVATGIYLVFGKSENGPESIVTKIAIIK